ncbi:TPA: amino acid ABC transporter permease [Escherichia coli]
MSHRRSTVKGSLSFANPTVRAWLFQILAVVAVVGIVGWLFHNTVTNLNNRGITSGFAFLDRGAGFGIVQHLIDYQQGDTYGRVFIVGLLNTLLVSALCIVFASVLGFFIGLARLSDNWLLRKLSTIYIEIFRNIPPLLQIFFWYFAVLRNLPGPRQAVSAFDLAFLSNRGLYIPSPQLGDGFIAFILAVVMAIVLSVGLFRFNKTYQIKTGQLRRTWPIAAVLIIGLPLLALGRRSHMPIVRILSVIFIEFWRGVPLITVLFMSSVMLPLFMAEGTSIDKLIRALVGVILFQSAYVAEVVRGGLQALPKGQYEAAESLALGYWKTQGLVILPQALKLVIPGLVNTIIALFKDTSLVIIIGLFDLFSSVQQATVDPAWLGMSTEGYVFAALIYWIFCFSMSRYSQHLEKRFNTGRTPH